MNTPCETTVSAHAVREKLLQIWMDSTPSPSKLYGPDTWWLTGEKNGVRLYTHPARTTQVSAAVGQPEEVDGVAYLFLRDGRAVWNFDGHSNAQAMQATFELLANSLGHELLALPMPPLAQASSPARKQRDVPFMTCVGDHVLIHDGETGTPLDATWTGVCCDARSASTFWYIGRNNGERSFSRLKASDLEAATAEAVIILRAECTSDDRSIAALLKSIWNTTPLDQEVEWSAPWWLTSISHGVKVYTSPDVRLADVSYLFMKDGKPVKAPNDHRAGGHLQSSFAEFQRLTGLLLPSPGTEPDGPARPTPAESMRG